MVTHNPELTRYANRVVFMHDGAIIADEKSALGQVSKTVRRSMYFLPHQSEEDDLAGVSVLMQTLPDGTSRRRKRTTKKSKSKPKTYKSKVKPKKTKGSRR
jgi:hypothetical protein